MPMDGSGISEAELYKLLYEHLSRQGLYSKAEIESMTHKEIEELRKRDMK